MKKIRVLIAEDHETVRQGLRALLADRADIEVVGEAPNGRIAVERVAALKPDIAVHRFVDAGDERPGRHARDQGARCRTSR